MAQDHLIQSDHHDFFEQMKFGKNTQIRKKNLNIKKLKGL